MKTLWPIDFYLYKQGKQAMTEMIEALCYLQVEATVFESLHYSEKHQKKLFVEQDEAFVGFAFYDTLLDARSECMELLERVQRLFERVFARVGLQSMSRRENGFYFTLMLSSGTVITAFEVWIESKEQKYYCQWHLYFTAFQTLYDHRDTHGFFLLPHFHLQSICFFSQEEEMPSVRHGKKKLKELFVSCIINQISFETKQKAFLYFLETKIPYFVVLNHRLSKKNQVQVYSRGTEETKELDIEGLPLWLKEQDKRISHVMYQKDYRFFFDHFQSSEKSCFGYQMVSLCAKCASDINQQRVVRPFTQPLNLVPCDFCKDIAQGRYYLFHEEKK